MATDQNKIKIGISSCLLGETVRFNGSHKRDAFIVDELSRHFEFQPFCPEVEAGLGIPRSPIRLIHTDRGDRAVDHDNYQLDHTDTLQQLADKQCPQLSSLSGYIFMQKSPSCGVFRVKCYNSDNGIPDSQGQGVFASRVRQRLPWLPVEEAGRLHDSQLSENFLIRVFTLADWQKRVEQQPTVAGLMAFQARNKYLLMAHNPQLTRQMGAALAALKKHDISDFLPRYRQLLMQALARPASRGQKVNALEHVKGYLKKYLTVAEKKSLQQIIQDYQAERIPFIVPLTMLRHLLSVHLADDAYLQQQRFLEPIPGELGYGNRD